MNFVNLCSFPLANVANAILSSNIHRQAMSTWESGCAGNDGDLGWAVKQRAEEMLMIYSQEAWGFLQHRLATDHSTGSHRRNCKDEKAPCKMIPGGRSGQTSLVSSFLSISTILSIPDPHLSHPQTPNKSVAFLRPPFLRQRVSSLYQA